MDNNEEEVGSAELSLEPELAVIDVQTARAFEDNDRFRTDLGVEDMYEADREKLFDGTVVFEVENRGNAPELVQSLELTEAESTEITYHGTGLSEDSTRDASFLNRPAYTDNWELGLARWWDVSKQDLNEYPDTHILERGQMGYFLTNPILYGNTGLDPVEDSVESVCQSGADLNMEGSVNGAAGDPVQIRLTRELTGEAVLYEENYRTDFWCRGQTLSLSDSSSGSQ